MLADSEVLATISVRDIAGAKEFYDGVLGLEQVNESPGGVTYKSGSSKLFVYQSSSAGTNQATSATWEVADIEQVVEGLKAKGVTFEHYEVPGAVLNGDILDMGGMKAAWFKDPDGNIICIANAH